MPNFIDLTGKTYNRWAVIERAKNDRLNQVCWLCKCSCGTTRVVTGTSLKSGQSKSCGCLRIEQLRRGPRFRHGMSKTRTHRIWCGIRSRCTNPNDPAYHYYGGRGIKVCRRWQAFESFLADMGPCPSPKHSLDRTNNGGDYSPANCRWATMREQQNNRRNNNKFWHKGQRLTLSEWARKTGIKRSTLAQRVYVYQWPIRRALTTPPRRYL